MIPSPPIGLASIAAFLLAKGFNVNLIDAFGEDPFLTERYQNNFVKIGLSAESIINKIDSATDIIGISVHSGMVAKFCLDLCREIKKKLGKPVIVGGPHVTINYQQFTEQGIDFAVVGEGELPMAQIVERISQGKNCSDIPWVVGKGQNEYREGQLLEVDQLPVPAWDLIPLENYWLTRMNHSPFTENFIPVTSSRGCPFKCAFCTTPITTKGKWRAYSPEKVVSEIKYLSKRFNVGDIVIQDDNFTANPKRAEKICKMLEKEVPGIRLSLPSGVRMETLSAELIKTLKQGGVNYISVSPESGSKKIRKLMNKPLNEKKFYSHLKHLSKAGIRTGVCFIIGSPGESLKDIFSTAKMMARVILYGADDISIFIFCPLPGAPMAAFFENEFPKDFLGLCWSPRWREDYIRWARIRYLLYLEYIILKILFQPLSVFKHFKNIVKKDYKTKGEMGFARLLVNYFPGRKKSWPAKSDSKKSV